MSHEKITASSLEVTTQEFLGEAGNSRGAARAARTIIARHGLRMTLIAPRNGHQLAQHAAQVQRLCGWSRAECWSARPTAHGGSRQMTSSQVRRNAVRCSPSPMRSCC